MASTAARSQPSPAADTVEIEVDGRPYTVTAGRMLLAALDDLGVLMREVDIPPYCWPPKLSVDASCRLCQVEIEGEPGLQTACSTPVREGMVVTTTSETVRSARQGVMELLLVAHPLDCPICDQAGECDLQTYSWRYGSSHSRSREPRRALDKHIDLGPTILLDRERCILCRRCVRFTREITGTGELAVLGRGDRSVIDVAPGESLDNPYSMNVADICPVGALTTKDFRFKVRVWDLASTPGVCTGCARGCNVHIDHARGEVMRYRPRRNDSVNDTWLCDEGRLSYHDIARPDRLHQTEMRGEDGVLVRIEPSRAISAAGRRLRALVDAKGPGVIAAIASPHSTNEELFALRRLLDRIGTDNMGLAVAGGESDELLVHAEKAANARGARELGFGDVRPIFERIRGGGIDGLLLFGHEWLGDAGTGAEGAPDDDALGAAWLEELDTVVLLDTEPSALVRGAHFVLPGRHLAEKTGTVTNFEGRVQRVEAAALDMKTTRAESEWVRELATAIGVAEAEDSYRIADLSLALAEAFPAFAGCELAALPAAGRLLSSPDGQGA
jgi:NADH-quinone oxidoreductase subunit G